MTHLHPNPYIDAILWGGWHWSGNPANVTYYFGTAGEFLPGYDSTWTTIEKNAYRAALQSFANVANITFTEVGTSGSATLIGLSVSQAYFGGPTLGRHDTPDDAPPNFGYFNYEGTGWDYSNPTGGLSVGGYGYLTLIHELGHAIGLAHPHDSGGTSGQFPGVTLGDSNDLGDNSLNQDVYTVMSYISGVRSRPLTGGAGTNNYGYTAGPMAFDIAALQYLYGANMSYNAGNNTYFLPDTNAAGTYFTCIWDAGGSDWIAYTGSSNAYINLTAATLDNSPTGGGIISQVFGIYGGFTIANGVLIENAQGGGGNDIIVGNAATNTLFGSGGNDTIYGEGGFDYAGYFGNIFDPTQYDFDEIIGGGYRVIDRAPGVNGNDGVDRIFGIEQLYSNLNQAVRNVSNLVPTVTFGSPSNAIANFSTAQGWNSDTSTPRTVGDINGDGLDDIIGFNATGTWVALSNGGGFGAAFQALAGFGANQGWSNSNNYPRQVADVNGDGREDIIGFGSSSTLVSLGQINGTFGSAFVAINGFSHSLGWTSQDQFTRHVGDINGDGRADIIGFGNAGVLAALGQADGTFGSNYVALSNSFNPANGWTSDVTYTRLLGDVNGDGRADIIGFGFPGVLVSLARDDNSGTFLAPYVAVAGYNPANGWTNNNTYPRLLADVTGDGRLDLIGFGNSVLVARSLADGTFGTLRSSLNGFNFANGWSSDNLYPREMADVNGDGRDDIVGFGGSGVLLALNSGLQFAAKEAPDFAGDTIVWDSGSDAVKPVSEFDYA